ncbi:universal stress protein [Desulfobacula phenolica]|uniref:Nucleotide-binding universal stress protein, UspA family n=1 Tax=Desulfobacula phenolica TaxID=90732 RepID=A0A1H2FVB8_9BACT|nr:universal stress protein [Desulfobacula phenolica]SDU10968.1 Nucleotide-binding universal stress protein, UspA family [Desulfobacula phenolica]
MKILVGYNGGEVGRLALSLARDYALKNNASVYIITSMQGGTSEKQSNILKAEENLEFAGKLMEHSKVKYDAQQSVRGLSPGEDLVKFAQENDIDHIFLGIKKTSRTQKAFLGSTSRHVILKAPCPVTTVKFNLDNMTTQELLRDRRLLVLDDEPDILETVEELLDMCFLDQAATFDEARKLIEHNRYDVAILDIMGVSGYDILELARKKDIPALMLTAHALTPENLKESIQKGADSYIPKDELANLGDHVADVIKTRIQGNQGYGAWFKKLKPFFDKSFGKGWREKDRKFWNSFDDKYGG